MHDDIQPQRSCLCNKLGLYSVYVYTCTDGDIQCCMCNRAGVWLCLVYVCSLTDLWCGVTVTCGAGWPFLASCFETAHTCHGAVVSNCPCCHRVFLQGYNLQSHAIDL